MGRLLPLNKLMNFTAQGGTFHSAPIGLLSPVLPPPDFSVLKAHLANLPIGYPFGEIVGGNFSMFVTASAGTTPTAEMLVEGTTSLTDLTTTTTTIPNNTATSITLASATGFAVGDDILVYDQDVTAYEWMHISALAGPVATVTRGIFGTTAQNFGGVQGLVPFVSKSQSWVTIPTGDGSAPELSTGNVDVSTPPVNRTLDLEALSMHQLDWPYIRVTIVVGGTASPTVTGWVNANLKFRANEAHTINGV